MKLVFTVLLFRLAATLAGKNANKGNNKNTTNRETGNTQHPAAFALR